MRWIFGVTLTVWLVSASFASAQPFSAADEPIRPLVELPIPAFESSELPVLEPLVSEPGIAYWWGSHVPPRVIVEHPTSGTTVRDRQGILYDLGSGEPMTEVVLPETPQTSRGGAVRVLRGEHRESGVLILETGQVRYPVPLGPLGERLGDVDLHLQPCRPEVFVVAEGIDGGHYYGDWEDLSNESFFLDTRLPFRAARVACREGGEVLDVWVDRALTELALRETPSPDLDGSAAVRLMEGEAPRCLAQQPTGEWVRPYYGFLDGALALRWDRDRTAELLDLESGEAAPLIEGDETVWVSAYVASPPRVLATTGSRFYIWSPERVVSWVDRAETPTGTHLGRLEQPILSHVVAERGSPSQRWIDLELGQLWRSPPLIALRSGAQPRLALAYRDAREQSLVLLDFDEGTLQEVASLECPGELRENRRLDGWAAIVCEEPTSDPHRYRLLWSELLDLEGQRRWRTDLMVEDILAPGEVILSDRSEYEVGASPTCEALYYVQLQGGQSP